MDFIYANTPLFNSLLMAGFVGFLMVIMLVAFGIDHFASHNRHTSEIKKARVKDYLGSVALLVLPLALCAPVFWIGINKVSMSESAVVTAEALNERYGLAEDTITAEAVEEARANPNSVSTMYTGNIVGNGTDSISFALVYNDKSDTIALYEVADNGIGLTEYKP